MHTVTVVFGGTTIDPYIPQSILFLENVNTTVTASCECTYIYVAVVKYTSLYIASAIAD